MPFPSEEVAHLLAVVESRSGHEALSEAKVGVLGERRQVVEIRDEERLVGLGVVAGHDQGDAGKHWSAETVVDPSMQFVEFEAQLVHATLAAVPAGASSSVWSRRTTTDQALERLGFSRVRALHQMDLPLPADPPAAGFEVERFSLGQEDDLVAVNAAAFADHREAGSLDLDEVRRLQESDWWDPDGVLFHRIDGVIVGFCWTKVHPDGVGEIYRIGVAEPGRGRRVGRNIVLAGFADLQERKGCTRGMLWVDGANTAAMRLYESIGMRSVWSIREYEATP